MSVSRKVWLPLIAGSLVFLLLEIALVMWVSGGHFIYTLDDPYIHLALAENLARFGHYGINLEEYSSPSSSIIWPLLLVPFFPLGLGSYGPLVLNIVFALATLPLLHCLIVGAARSHGRPASSVSWMWAVFIFFAVGGFGIVFTGMEHSLHVLVTVAIMYFVNRMQLAVGEDRELRSGHDDYCLVLCIVLSPLVRFEGLAISAFAILMLIALGKLRLAIFSAFLIGLSLGLYAYAMSALGLPWLPSSVLMKSAVAADISSMVTTAEKIAGLASHVADNVMLNLEYAEARLLLLIAFLLTAYAARAWSRAFSAEVDAGSAQESSANQESGARIRFDKIGSRSGERVSLIYVAGVIAVIGLHLAFGRFGWMGRYQAYLAAFTLCAAIHVFSGPLLKQHADAGRAWLVRIAAALTVVILGFQQNVLPVVQTPFAARNIYEQQFHMHEFVTRHWKAPIAVNDIGQVSFQNDLYVLDLYGLASEEARQLGRARDPDLLPKLTGKRDIHLAIIYEDWFPGYIPADWHKIGEMRLVSPRIVTPYDSVSFFVFGLDQAGCLHVADKLAEFKRTLAQPETLTLDGQACSRVNISKIRAVSATNP